MNRMLIWSTFASRYKRVGQSWSEIGLGKMAVHKRQGSEERRSKRGWIMMADETALLNKNSRNCLTKCAQSGSRGC